MPNWTFNDLKVETTEWLYEDKKELKEAKKQLDEFIESSVDEEKESEDRSSADLPRGDEKKPIERVFSFQGVVPMPKSLRITSGTSTERGMAYIDWIENKNPKRIDTILGYGWVEKEIDKRWSKDKQRTYLCASFKKGNADWKDDLKKGRMALSNIKKYGAKDWYDWCNLNWGTKWDACNSHITDEGRDEKWEEYFIRISFDTAWSPPYEYLQKATQKYPLLRFICRVEEESEAFLGNLICQWGELVDNTTTIDFPKRDKGGEE